MSITPFSPNEIINLREFLEKNGWKLNASIEDYFRYSIKKEKLVLFTIKFPITLPIRLNIPFEVVCFRISIAFQFWNLNKNTYKIIFYIIKSFRNLVLSLSLEHQFPIEGKKQELVNLLNLILPEFIKGENENTWLNRIRISLMNKRDQLSDFSNTTLQHIVTSLNDVGLQPSFKIPWELKYGVPKLRTTETLLFSNEEKFEEFFILEKGYFTYFKDLVFNKFYIRSSFDSYTPYILNTLFKDIDYFNFNILIKNWIIFARMALNSIIEVLDNSNINQNELIQFRYSKELSYYAIDFFSDQNNFPFSALSYESLISKELYSIHNDLFNKPPQNFEVLESIYQYIEAEELIKNYRFEEATNILNESLKVFNKNQQKKIIVAILLKLRKIASLLNQNDIALNYLKTALGITKSGEVPTTYIIKIHFKLGLAYYKNKDFSNALKHFEIIINFLENENIFLNKEKYLGFANLYTGFIHLKLNKVVESRNYFKKALEIGNNFIKVKLKYFLLRALEFKNNGNISQFHKFLRFGLNSVELDFTKEEYKNVLIDLVLELSEFYIHYRKDAKKAIYYLNSMEDYISPKEIKNIHKVIRWNLLMSDYYNSVLTDRKKSRFYLDQIQKLKIQLQTIGVKD